MSGCPSTSAIRCAQRRRARPAQHLLAASGAARARSRPRFAPEGQPTLDARGQLTQEIATLTACTGGASPMQWPASRSRVRLKAMAPGGIALVVAKTLFVADAIARLRAVMMLKALVADAYEDEPATRRRAQSSIGGKGTPGAAGALCGAALLAIDLRGSRRRACPTNRAGEGARNPPRPGVAHRWAALRWPV